MPDLTTLHAVIHATTDTDREAVLDALNEHRLSTDPAANDPDPLTTVATGHVYGTRTTTDTGELLAAALLKATRDTAFVITQFPTDAANGLYITHTPRDGTRRAQCNTEGIPVVPIEPHLRAESAQSAAGIHPHIRSFLDLSTLHLAPATRDALNSIEGVLAYRLEHGWLMYAPESADERARAYDWPTELLPIVQLARAHNCAYILFDADADVTDQLPAFDDQLSSCQPAPPTAPDYELTTALQTTRAAASRPHLPRPAPEEPPARIFTLAGHPEPLTLPARPTTDDAAPLPHGLTLDDAVAVRAHQVRPGDLLIAEFTDGTGIRPTQHIPAPYPADPHPLPACPCTGCKTCDEVTTWTRGDHSRTADTGWRFVCLAPSQDGEPCTIVLRDRPMAVIPADVVARAQAARPRVSTADLTPVSAFDDAQAKLCAAAKDMLTLVAATLHRQFPTAGYLVLTRPTDYDDYDSVRLDSVRDACGEVLREFEETPEDDGPLPAVPEDIAALWGGADPSQTGDVLNLIQRADQVAPYEFLKFLPSAAMRGNEANAERTPLGIPLDPEAVCPQHGTACEPDDHIEPPTVNGEVI